jgi:hypothetical protein
LYHCAYLTDWEYKVLGDYFNTTYSFRDDADIFIQFGRVVLKSEFSHRKKEGRWIKRSKTKLKESVQMRKKKSPHNMVLIGFTLYFVSGLFCL